MRNVASGLLGSLALAVVMSALGCAAEPRELSTPRTASELAVARTSTMSLDEAQAILNDLAKTLAAGDAQNPLRAPKTLDDVLAILQSDQVDLFPAAVKVAKADPSPKAQALAAQIELAWGENLRIAAQLIDALSADLREEARELSEVDAVGKATPQEKQRLEKLEKLVSDEDRIVAALAKVAPTHLREGAALASALVKKAPEGYEGYRVLADYHRIRADWAAFDGMVKEVEAKNPDSTGLLFLKGIAEAERKGDLEKGIGLLRQALTKDPKFCRAQAQILFMSNGFTAKYEELGKLRAMNAKHQLVVLAGPVFDTVNETREQRRARQRRLDWRAL
ncbi:MAG: hypothetical protein U0183_24095 [Polyangiaceae bacterium]|jgi:hypothetical protein